MELLKQRILKEGKAQGNDILKVDSFLNHQIDPVLIRQIGKEFANRFADLNVTKILTIEASGIAPALMTGLELGVPVVFAKKSKAVTMDESVYSTVVKSFTKQQNVEIMVSKDYLKSDDRVLIIDDFLARGQACFGLIDIINQSGAELVGIGILIEKGFQPGGREIRKLGIRVETLVTIDSLVNNKIIIANN